MKLSDYVVDFIADTGVKHVFMLPGGGVMHLNDSLGSSNRLQFICNLHEQACAIAAEAYGQYTNNLGVCMVTTGPGATNTLTGVAAGWMDSTPMLVISGQVKVSDLCHEKGIRQMGFQEINIIPIVESITKYAVTIKDPDTIRYHIGKAIWLAQNGRPGPSWIDIPLDIQAMHINPDKQKPFSPNDEKSKSSTSQNNLLEKVGGTLKILSKSKKPVILVGNGVRLSKAELKILELIKKLNIPVLTTWKALDLFEELDPLFMGRPGAIGQRAANIIQQRSDFFMMVGARMDMGQTAYMHKYPAQNAKKIMVDIDQNEINKMSIKIDVSIPIDAGLFIDEMLKQLNYKKINSSKFASWRAQCRIWKKLYPVNQYAYFQSKDGVDIYSLLDVLSEEMRSGDLFIPGSSGSCSEISMQSFKSKKGIRVFNSEGMGPMGFGISAALGGCIASGKKRTICIDGDGGFAMNTQELETVRRLKLPILYFVLDNGGYASIRSTQKTYFNERYVGSSKGSGLTLPSLRKIADAYGIHFMELKKGSDIKSKLKETFNYDGPVICRVKVTSKQITAPRVINQQTKNGGMETAPMEKMWPKLIDE